MLSLVAVGGAAQSPGPSSSEAPWNSWTGMCLSRLLVTVVLPLLVEMGEWVHVLPALEAVLCCLD